jgi:hypothetical protein
MMVMSSVVWHHLIGVDAAGLRRARVQTHSAAQWLARAALAYIPARPDDGHTNFGWSDTFGGFVTHALPDGARLGLKVTDLTLAVLDHAGADTAIMLPLDGCSDAQVRAWLGRQMAARGLDPYALDNPTPYEMPALANGAVYEAAELANLLSVLTVWYSNANAALGARRLDIIERNLGVRPVRCWPHHFDLDTLVTIAPGRTTGVGFSPGDDFYNEPYFYVSLYPGPDGASLPPLPAIGRWHTMPFTAAIATARRIVEAKDQKREVEGFLDKAVEIAIKALSCEAPQPGMPVANACADQIDGADHGGS